MKVGDSDHLKALGGNILLKSAILGENTRKKLESLRRSTIGKNFLESVKKNETDKAEGFLGLKQLMKQNNVVKNSGDAVKAAIENQNDYLVMILKQQGFTAPLNLLYESIVEHKDVLVKGLVKFGFYSEQCVFAYFWHLLKENYLEEAHDLLITNQELERFQIGNDIEIRETLENKELMISALDQAVSNKFDLVAENIIIVHPELLSYAAVQAALDSECLNFLKTISTGASLTIQKTLKKAFSTTLFLNQSDPDSVKLKETLEISQILAFYISQKRYSAVRTILTWKEIKDSPNILNQLISSDIPDISKETLMSFKIKPTPSDFFLAFDKEYYKLCVSMLSMKFSRISFRQYEFQDKLIKLMSFPETCLESIEIISRIPTGHWREAFTSDFCARITKLVKRSEALMFCEQPIMFCILAAEFLKKVSEKYYQHKAKCLKAVEMLLGFCNQLLAQIKGEEELKYYVLQIDSRKRTSLEIIASNHFSIILENEDLGSIIEKSWDRSINSFSFFEASSVYSSFNSQYATTEAMMFTDKMNMNREYIFQYQQWKQSPKNRFLFAQGISCLFLIILDMVLIYNAINDNSFWNLTSDPNTNPPFKFFQAWVLGIAAEQILHSLFAWKSKRTDLINIWKVLDIMLFIMIILISLQEFNGFGSTVDYLPEENKNYIVYILHSIMVVLLWMKLASVILVSWACGPFLRIIYFMIAETLNFFIILLSLFICAAGVFTAVFNTSPLFVTYDISLRTVFADAMGGFDLTKFTKYIEIGSITESLYVMISNIVLLNLLIAIISSVYEELDLRVKREHREVLISYSKKYTWDKKYGILIFLPSPISSLVLMLSPLVVFSKKPEVWNKTLCKIAFIGYAWPQFLVFFAIGLAFAIPLYLKGFWIYTADRGAPVSTHDYTETLMNNNLDIKPSKFRLFRKGLIWLFIGIPLVLWAVFRDCYHFWVILYAKPTIEVETVDQGRFSEVLDSEFIKTIQKTLKSIKVEEITLEEFYHCWKLFDEILNPDSTEERNMEANDFFKQFLLSKKKQIINITYFKRLLPRLKGGFYDSNYLHRARYLNSNTILSGIRKFHGNIGALNVAGVTLPKPEPRGEFDMVRINTVNSSIKELEDYYSRLTKLTIQITEKLQKELE